jgi:hypothetical protein
MSNFPAETAEKLVNKGANSVIAMLDLLKGHSHEKFFRLRYPFKSISHVPVIVKYANPSLILKTAHR